MKKNVIISFITATIAFCVLLHYFLVFTDHHANKILIAAFLAGIILSCVAMAWLFNKYFKVTLHKGPDTNDNKSPQE